MKYIDTARHVDGAFAACLKANGYDGVIRYLDDSWGKSEKCINETEAGIIAGAGLKLLLVFETCGGAAAPGCAKSGVDYFTTVGQGTYDAQHAYAQAQNVRYGDGFPIFFGVDYDASEQDMAAMESYWQSVHDVLADRWPVGDYGSYTVVKYNKERRNLIVPRHWQTYAWSGGLWLDGVDVRQTQNAVVVCGRQVDLDETDMSGWNMDGEFVTQLEFQQYKDALQDQLNKLEARIVEETLLQINESATIAILKPLAKANT